jgi:dihydrofolate reductase
MNMIIAVDKNFGIGKDGTLPWYLPPDLKYFQDMTKGGIVIMGKNTYMSIPQKFRPLKNRINIVISNTFIDKDVYVCNDKTIFNLLEKLNSNNIWIIGGKQIYELFINHVNTIYLTQINQEYNCDLFLDRKLIDDFKLINTVKQQYQDIEFYFQRYVR